MPTIPQSELPKPKSWNEFEDIVWDLYARLWRDPNAQRYGRSGQRQQGVDIYGQPEDLDGQYVGIQCKRYEDGSLTRTRIEKEIAEAEHFRPPLAEYIIAATEHLDAKLQTAVREIDAARRAADKFPVHIVFWEDLCSRLCDEGNNDLLLKHYGDWVRRLIQARDTAPPSYTPLVPPHPDTLPDPGALPPGSRLPFTRSALFIGREMPLKQLAGALLHDQVSSALVTQAVAGMGGVGKTQLAVEFAYRYGRFFRGVHWVNAGAPEGLAAEVAACGAAMRLADWPGQQPEQIARTLDAWRQSGPRLVVLDNLEDVGPAREWLGRLSGGGVRVLITARRQDWPRDLGLDPLRLEVFSEEESRAFLRKYLAEERALDADVDRLAARLGHLPLALELAGRYLGSLPRLTVDEYMEKIEDVWTHPSMAGWREELGNPTGHDLDLAKTFAASWDRVEDEVACHLFLMLGYCAPNQPVPCEVLEKAADLDKEACDEAVGVLAGLGLVEVEAAAVGPLIHPLLGEYARALPDALGALPALADALKCLTHETLETGLPTRFAPQRPHVKAVACAAEETGLEDAGVLWNNLGCHLQGVADYAGARTAFRRALAVDQWIYGPEHPNVAIRVNNLGEVLRAMGDFAGAQAAFERVLDILDRTLPPKHPYVASTWNNLGMTLYGQGDFAGARVAFERALAIDEQLYGPEHPNVATDVNNLGLVLQSMGDLAGAQTSYERALTIDEQFYGPEHPNVATRLNNLGEVMRDQGDLAGARVAFERALAIWQAVYGSEHPQVGMVLGNLGKVLLALGDLEPAHEACEQALRILRASFGEEHPHVATAYSDLAGVLQARGDLVRARAAYELALAISEKSLPEGHPHIEIVQRHLESLGRGE